eukprot:336667-Chlamydomonas_euryale.AAC.9
MQRRWKKERAEPRGRLVPTRLINGTSFSPPPALHTIVFRPDIPNTQDRGARAPARVARLQLLCVQVAPGASYPSPSHQAAWRGSSCGCAQGRGWN